MQVAQQDIRQLTDIRTRATAGIRTRAEPGLGSTAPGARALSGRAVERAGWAGHGREGASLPARACARAPVIAWRAAGPYASPQGQGRSQKGRAPPDGALRFGPA